MSVWIAVMEAATALLSLVAAVIGLAGAIRSPCESVEDERVDGMGKHPRKVPGRARVTGITLLIVPQNFRISKPQSGTAINSYTTTVGDDI
jgi:hypothetical protein